MYEKKPFSFTETVRRGRCSNPYHGSFGKHLVAIDDALELINRFFAELPVPQTRASFARQGNFIGLVKKSKRLILALHSMETDPNQKGI